MVSGSFSRQRGTSLIAAAGTIASPGRVAQRPAVTTTCPHTPSRQTMVLAVLAPAPGARAVTTSDPPRIGGPNHRASVAGPIRVCTVSAECSVARRHRR